MATTNVLVIDEKGEEASAIAHAVEACGMSASMYESGHEALSSLSTANVGLVIGSITLPGENILELFRSLKKLLGSAELPCIVILPEGTKHSPEDLSTFGVTDIALRPLHMPELGQKVVARLSKTGVFQSPASPVERAIKSALAANPSDGSQSPVGMPTANRPSQPSLLTDGPDEEPANPDENAEKRTSTKPESRTRSPRYEREGQVFDDPTDKLNADLTRSIRAAKRNRLLVLGLVLTVVTVSVVILLEGRLTRRTGDSVEVQERAPVLTAPAGEEGGEGSSEPGAPVQDPFQEILQEKLEVGREVQEFISPNVPRETAKKSRSPFSVQVGAFAMKANAEEVFSRLAKKGYDVKIVRHQLSSGKVLELVLVGRFPSRESAGEELLRLTREENIQGFVTRADEN